MNLLDHTIKIFNNKLNFNVCRISSKTPNDFNHIFLQKLFCLNFLLYRHERIPLKKFNYQNAQGPG